jgi:rhodanese-related sulfurtransferase
LAQKLQERGYKAYALQGGFDGWKDAGYPVDKKRQAA